jgi:hypothetical protein
LATAGQRRDDLVGEGFNIEGLGQCGHIRTLSEVMEGTSEGSISITSECPLLTQSGRRSCSIDGLAVSDLFLTLIKFGAPAHELP